MNAFGDRFRCVFLLSTSPSPCAADDAEPAEHCAAVLPMGPSHRSVEEEAAAHIQRFCAAHALSFVDFGHDRALLDKALLDRTVLPPVSLLRGIGPCAVRCDGVIAVELRCGAAVTASAGVAHRDVWDWLRPVPSWLSELRGNGWEEGRDVAVCIPTRVRCAEPILRTARPKMAPEQSAVAVTMDALMREVGYRVGRLPKYGS